MLNHTHNLPDENGEPGAKVSQCTCGSCENVFWVRCAAEFQPSYCPYCGIKFQWYDAGDEKFNIAGQPLKE